MHFSIIVPVYNVEKYLGKCLDSLLGQNYDNYELIIVDDGSTDNSGRIADEYAVQYSNIKVIHQNNRGLGGARNTGIEASTGEYLIFIDSDDYVVNNYLSRLNEILYDRDLDILMYNVCAVSENGRICGKLFDWNEGFKEEDDRVFLNEEPSAINKVYKRNYFCETGIRFPEHLLYEDLATIPMFASLNPKVGRINESLYYYRQRRDSIMRETDSEKLLQIIRAMERVIKYFKEKSLYNSYYSELEWLALRHVLCRTCGRLLLPIEKTDWQAIEKLDVWMHENFPNFLDNAYYVELRDSDERKYMENVIKKRYRFVQFKYYGKIRMKKRIKFMLLKLRIFKE